MKEVVEYFDRKDARNKESKNKKGVRITDEKESFWRGGGSVLEPPETSLTKKLTYQTYQRLDLSSSLYRGIKDKH